jgi:Major Facilitator Superfamily
MDSHHRRFIVILVFFENVSGFLVHRSDADAWVGLPVQLLVPVVRPLGTTGDLHRRYQSTTTISKTTTGRIQCCLHQQQSQAKYKLGWNVQCAAASSSTGTSTEMPQEEIEIDTNTSDTTTDSFTMLALSTGRSAVTKPLPTSLPQQQPEQEQEQQLEVDRITVLVLLWCIAAISALDRVAMSVALVPMSYEYRPMITDTMKGLISSLFSIGYGFAIIPAGLLISCISPKTLMTFGILIWSLATIVTPVAAEFITLTAIPILCIRSIVGMGEAILIPTVHRLLSVWTTSEQKSSGTCNNMCVV